MSKGNRSIFQIFRLASLRISVVIGVFAAVLVVSILYREVSFNKEYSQTQLGLESQKIAERVVGDFLIADHEAVEGIFEEFTKRFDLSSAEIIDKPSNCISVSTLSLALTGKGSVCIEIKLPLIKPAKYLRTTKHVSRQTEGQFIAYVLLACLPLFLFGLVSIITTERMLKKSVIDPLTQMAKRPNDKQGFDQKVAREIVELDSLNKKNMEKIESTTRDLEASKFEATIGAEVSKIIHNIRGPLAGLRVAEELIKKRSPERVEDGLSLLVGSREKLQEHANAILDKWKGPNKELRVKSTPKIKSVGEIASNVVLQKAAQYTSENINLHLIGGNNPVAAKVEIYTLENVLANLIENSIDATTMQEERNISVRISMKENDCIQVAVGDNGKGIPSDLVEKVFERGFSYDKGGSGLGLDYVKSSIENAGGKVSIESKDSIGTIVRLLLPVHDSKNMYLDSVRIGKNEAVVVVDDDYIPRAAWEQKFKGENINNIRSFESSEFLRKSMQTNQSLKENSLFLIDFHLSKNGDTDGLNLIKELGIRDRSVLVTGAHDHPDVLNEAMKMGIPIVKKDKLSEIEIQIC